MCDRTSISEILTQIEIKKKQIKKKQKIFNIYFNNDYHKTQPKILRTYISYKIFRKASVLHTASYNIDKLYIK